MCVMVAGVNMRRRAQSKATAQKVVMVATGHAPGVVAPERLAKKMARMDRPHYVLRATAASAAVPNPVL